MVSSTRRLLGLILVIAAAVVAVWSAFAPWYGGRKGTNIRFLDLFDHGLTVESAATMTSLLLPMLVSAVLVLAGILVWWRWLWTLAGAVAIATVVLWGARQAQNPSGLHSALVGAGPIMAACAGTVMIFAASIATVREGRTRQEPIGRLSPEWTPAPATRVGDTEAAGEPRAEERTQPQQNNWD
ncbi:hypothetical protein KDK95_09140 [Actinospica sp. MGRD01-02]|uniref:Uncharacterized protein n=1 Tax=Actinospica acidithermotolerans TaxID=2828514 RepID=A0A941EA60_9ACTN|nr:hypothetical protein [Actinospica acidithermotolerans]MBR7826465.1 hypothetical protein [Actinospica acidithermotolerans]